jgi:hypothetical protein
VPLLAPGRREVVAASHSELLSGRLSIMSSAALPGMPSPATPEIRVRRQVLGRSADT